MRTIKFLNASDKKNAGGFTLVEMAIVVIVFGIIAATFTALYTQYITTQREQITRGNVEIAHAFINDFLKTYGRYPCPASLTLTRTDANYGRETDCTDKSTSIAKCEKGICIRAMNGDDQLRVRIGFLPFRPLNLTEEDAYDGYGGRIMYAVTESLTNSDTFRQNGGTIDIQNEFDQSLLETPGTANFVVFSYGKNQDGAYDRQGNLHENFNPETHEGSGIAERINSDLVSGQDAIFKIAQYSTSEDKFNFDDVFKYADSGEIPYWQVTEESNRDIRNKIIGNQIGGVGIALPPSSEIQDTLDVGGALRISDDSKTGLPVDPTFNSTGNYICFDPETLEPHLCTNGAMGSSVPANYASATEGKLMVDEICDSTGNNCFTPELLAGNQQNGGGLMCPTDKPFLQKIEHGHAVCSDEIEFRCPGGKMMRGIDANGNFLCDVPPPADCPTADVTVCAGTPNEATRHLPASSYNMLATVAGGDSFQQDYKCNPSGSVEAGGWVSWGAPRGVCVCDASTPDQTQTRSCAAGLAGSYTVRRHYICPQGTWSPWEASPPDAISQSCSCAAGQVQQEVLPCPNGANYPGAGVTRTRTSTCDGGTPGWTDWTEVEACTCQVHQETRTRTCSLGFEGSIHERRTFNCGATPGWSPWEEESRNCTCQQGTEEIGRFPCEEGYEGTIEKRRTFNCNGTEEGSWGDWTEVSRNCVPRPVVTCFWRSVGGSSLQAGSGGRPKIGSACECGTAAVSQCYGSTVTGANGQSSQIVYNGCTCN